MHVARVRSMCVRMYIYSINCYIPRTPHAQGLKGIVAVGIDLKTTNNNATEKVRGAETPRETHLLISLFATCVDRAPISIAEYMPCHARIAALRLRTRKALLQAQGNTRPAACVACRMKQIEISLV